MLPRCLCLLLSLFIASALAAETYTFGMVAKSQGNQFFEAARCELGDLNAMFRKGEFAPLLGWLRTNIHHVGRRYTARQLVRKLTGEDLNHHALMDHLKRKAAEFYGV